MKNNGLKLVTLLICATLLMGGCGKAGDDTSEKGSKPGKNVSTSLTSASDSKTDVKDEKDETEVDHLLIAKSEEPFSFCTKYSEDYSYKWDPECGITIYTEKEGSIPYVMVWRSFDAKSTAEELHSGDKSDMYYQYGNDLISAGEPKAHSLGGKELSGAEYVYNVGEFQVKLLRLIDTSPSTGYVLYSAKYLDSSEDSVLEALETAIKYYKAGKDAYEVSDGKEPELEIVPSPTKNISYETIYDGWYNIDIPKGWVIDASSFDGSAACFAIHAYDPDAPDRQFYIGMQTLCFVSENAYTKLCNYPLAGSAFKGIPYLLGGQNPVEEFYQNFEVFRNCQYPKYMSLAPITEWTSMESFGETPLGGELIRASYKGTDGMAAEGIFSAKWVKGPTMYGYQYPGVFYSPMYFTAPEGEFNEWADILNHCICSLKYTENYIDSYYAEEKSTMKAFEANTQIYNEMSDMITSSWNERQKSYDTISEKQSDATLGYDRVYNTETQEIYRVPVGFMDSYSGSLYKEIDDSMYSLPIDGYIYK